MELRDFIIKTLGELIEKPITTYGEVMFDINVIPVEHIVDGKKVQTVMVIGEGNPNHSRIKFTVRF